MGYNYSNFSTEKKQIINDYIMRLLDICYPEGDYLGAEETTLKNVALDLVYHILDVGYNEETLLVYVVNYVDSNFESFEKDLIIEVLMDLAVEFRKSTNS